jgi:galactose-1-phosphate uridylyltransferase
MMEKQLSPQLLEKILIRESLNDLSQPELIDLIASHEGISKFAPDGFYQVDPRNGERIVYNSSRARRPHDNREQQQNSSINQDTACVICEGKTTGVIDVAELSNGFTFINENLFPMVHPKALLDQKSEAACPDKFSTDGTEATGMHLLHWTSSIHSDDWDNMPLADLEISFERLTALEQLLLQTAPARMPSNREWGDSSDSRGYVSIIKNYGRPVGGSLAHGHQQICFSNTMPRRFLENLNFERNHNERFSAYLDRVTEPSLEVLDLGEARLLVPYFMRRPYDMILLVKDTSKRYLYQLSQDELKAVVRGWKVATRAMLSVLTGLGREPAYNVVIFNGPGAGIYIEFLPFTQETGGFELAGLSVCQSTPLEAATYLRDIVSSDRVE